ncbi:MAG TPA: response regulator transcription factor [Saprospiraceae bacterium]|nr:response regulator transcription factor [Saprospiraceae bacterium]
MSNQARILIVDDEEDILELLKYNLQREGYVVETALEGNSAIQKMHIFNPHLVILDIMMPGMDGIEVCEKIRTFESFKNTVIVFLTARSESFTQMTAYDTGGDDFVNKPIKLNVFKSRIKANLRRHPDFLQVSSPQHILNLGDLEINLEKFKVTRDHKEIQLAKKEFELIALLASKPGKVFKREEIMSRIWGNEVIVGDRTIDVHIRKLREKIGEDYITTMKGVGYKLDF